MLVSWLGASDIFWGVKT